MLEESILSQLPGFVAVKAVDENVSKYIWANPMAAKIAGIKNNDQMIGLTDADLKCCVADYTEVFHKQDLYAMKNGGSATLDIYAYAEENIVGLLGQRSPYKNEQGETIGVICTAIPVYEEQLTKIASLVRLMQTNNKVSSFNYDIVSTYSQLNLTTRESECFFYLLRGKSAKQIAACMGISKRTAESHINHIKFKTDTHNKSQLFDLAYNLGLLDIIPHSVFSKRGTILL